MDVLTSRAGSTGIIEISRPHRANAIGGTLMKDVLHTAEAMCADDGIGAILTTGAGSTFCVGADLVELGEKGLDGPIDLMVVGVDGIGGAKGLDPLPPAQDTLGVGRWTQRFLAIGKPTVAAINGGAAGGGLAIALLHDVRIAARGARMSFSWSLLGLAPEMGISWLLPHLFGAARAFELLSRTSKIDADEALELGLVQQVVEPDELREAALAEAERLAQIPAGSYAEMKALLRSSGQPLEAQLADEWAAQTRRFLAGVTQPERGASAPGSARGLRFGSAPLRRHRA
jgi:enoyl-CoA hydratase/carnithine racemase